jgi:hypothetical protein
LQPSSKAEIVAEALHGHVGELTQDGDLSGRYPHSQIPRSS